MTAVQSPPFPSRSPAKLTVLLYCQNHATMLKGCLLSVVRSAEQHGASLVAVSNATDDVSKALLANCGIKTLHLESQLTPGAALNAGLRLCSGHVVLLRADTLPESSTQGEPCWLAALLTEAERHPQAGILAARSVTMDGRILADGHTLVSGLGLHHPGYLRRHLEADGDAPEAFEVDSADLHLAFMRREMLEAVGACHADSAVFDENYDPAGLMDDDLAFAARVAGFGVMVTGRVKAVSLAPAPPPEGAQIPLLTAALEQTASLRHVQAEYWARKWNWDPLLPDLGRVRRLYGQTAVCWRTGSVLRWRPVEACPSVDLCMVTWNGAAHLERCLTSLAATRYPAERLTLYLVDNASTDSTPQLLEKLLPKLPFTAHVQRLKVNVGGVAGMNWAMAEGSGQLVAKLDDDIIVPSDWLEQLTAIFSQRPFAGVLGPRIVDDTPAGRIQCADYRCHPVPTTHEQEPDEGQSHALARVTHVRGCCNLYRRDAIERCGPLDIRFSPSQWDDPEHQLALLSAGYEVLHVGSVAVAHKMTTGSISSGLSLANAALNKAKMLVKWGQSAPEILECGLLLSEEGRYVKAFQDPEPLCRPLPSRVDAELVRHLQQQTAACTRSSETALELQRALRSQALQLRQQAVESRQKGAEVQVLPLLRSALSCAPHEPLLIISLADALADNGAALPAQRLRCRAEALHALSTDRGLPAQPEDTARLKPLAPLADVSRRNGVPRKNALWCLPFSLRYNRPLLERLQIAACELAPLDWAVTLDCTPCPHVDAASYDCVHFWTLSESHESLAQIKAAATLQPNLTRLLTPLQDTPEERSWLLQMTTHLRQNGALEKLPPWPEHLVAPLSEGLFRREALALSHHILLRDLQEARLLGLDPDSPACRLVGSLPLDLPLPPPDPRFFREASGLHEFVLAVAPIEPASGQAQLLTALARLNLPVVLVGEAPEAWYLHLCRRLLPSCLFVSEAEPELLASAFAAARVHALPSVLSLGEPAALYAACTGAGIVLTRNSAEHRMLAAANRTVYPCDPWSIQSIATAVSKAWEQGARRAVHVHQHLPQPGHHRLVNTLASVYATCISV